MKQDKPKLSWSWSSYLSSYRATTNKYWFTVTEMFDGNWRVEIERNATVLFAHDKCRTPDGAMKWAERRLLRWARSESKRMARIEQRLGGAK